MRRRCQVPSRAGHLFAKMCDEDDFYDGLIASVASLAKMSQRIGRRQEGIADWWWPSYDDPTGKFGDGPTLLLLLSSLSSLLLLHLERICLHSSRYYRRWKGAGDFWDEFEFGLG